MKLDITFKLSINFFFLNLLFFFLASTSAFASYKNIIASDPCNFNREDFHKNINFIEIKVDKNKSLIKNIIKTVMNNKMIKKEAKKTYSSEITFNYKKNQICEHDAKLRIHGDFTDHVDIVEGEPIASFQIKLKNGNINNLTSFILFLPRTRGYFNEIFITNFFHNIGILAPRTNLVKVKFNGKIHDMLFQEKISKEFLEINGHTESFILKGDDNNLYNKLGGNTELLTLAKLGNAKLIEKSDDYFNEAIIALSRLNQIYLNSNIIKFEKKYSDEWLIFHDSFEGDRISNDYFDLINNIFETFMTVLDARHGLSQDDRIFYYDPHYKNYLPIYYDGGGKLLTPNEYSDLLQNFDISSGTDFRISKKFYLNEDYSPLGSNYCYEKCLKIIDNIDKSKFILDLKKSGMNISLDQIDNIFRLLKERLKIISNHNYFDNTETQNKNPYFSLFNYKYKANIVFIDNFNNVIFCPIGSKNKYQCKTIFIKDKDKIDIFRKILSQGYVVKRSEYIFVSNNPDDYFKKLKKFKKEKNEIEFKTFKVKALNKGKIKVDNKDRIIKLISNNPNERFIIYGQSIEDWTLEYKEQFDSFADERLNLLTGCMTFLDLELNDIKLLSQKSSCEDTFNFIRTKGSIKSINISGSIRDAVDADFSNIEFKNVNIQEVGNDCIDFSYGKYVILYANLKECGDKGISIGEKSFFKANSVNIRNSKTAVSVKDSSKANIDNFYAQDIVNCLSVYKKKQEFYGGEATINNFNCDKFSNELDYDNVSTIKIKTKFKK